MTKQLSLFAFFFSVFFTSVRAQSDKTSELFIELKTLDSIFFARGFDQCDLMYLESRITDDLKFYHDQSGLQDKHVFLENVQNYICSTPDKKPIRKVDTKSLEVFPLHNNGELYGAIQKGSHQFYLRESGKEDEWTSTAQFTHIWILDKEIWKLSIVLSYDH